MGKSAVATRLKILPAAPVLAAVPVGPNALSTQKQLPEVRPAQKAGAQITQANAATAVSLQKPKAIVPAKGPVLQKQASAADNNKPYLVIVVTFRNKASALQEVAGLNREGFGAFIIQRDPYYMVAIGAYSDKDSAQKMVNKMQRRYKGVYVKSR